jgi:hypothetical protein
VRPSDLEYETITTMTTLSTTAQNLLLRTLHEGGRHRASVSEIGGASSRQIDVWRVVEFKRARATPVDVILSILGI